jgi:replication factor C subunit 1
MKKKEKIIKEKKTRENKNQYEYTNNISVLNNNINININNDNYNDNKDVKIDNEKNNLSWLYKYTPKDINEILGNKEEIKILEKWLKNFKNEKYSSMIISGNHGTGKNIIMTLLFHKFGYIIKQIHSSQMKNKSVLDEILHICNRIVNISYTLSTYNKNIQDDNQNIPKYAIIIDDTDSVSLTSEKDNILKLFISNETNKYFPLIFINNLQHSKLITDIKKLSSEIIFNIPSNDDLKKFTLNIINKEKINIGDNRIIELIIKFSQRDIRRLLNILQDLYFTFGSNIISFDDFRDFLNISQKKDVDVCLIDATISLLNKYNNINYAMQLYENEKVLLPLVIHENYYKKFNDNNTDIKNILDVMTNISDSISIGDIIETNIYTDQNWFLQSIHGFITCVYTSYQLDSINKKSKKKLILTDKDFSSDLNKTSLKNINKKNITNLQNTFNKNTLDDILLINKYLVEIHNLHNDEIINDKKFNNIIDNIKNNYNINNRIVEISINVDKTIDKIKR